jgi:hypothetical protein
VHVVPSIPSVTVTFGLPVKSVEKVAPPTLKIHSSLGPEIVTGVSIDVLNDISIICGAAVETL